ncbi:MAG: hypothetical protein KA712_17290 [Myxococcales bacterium]|nr:hypothetical protein [Myxococcales bacterium]
MSLFSPFRPQPGLDELPSRFPDPFGLPPHPLAERAAAGLRERLTQGTWALPEEPGKMFGVLVARDAQGQIGYLQAYSGFITDPWDVTAFVPGTWDVEEKRRVWEPRVRVLKALSAQIDRVKQGEEAEARRALDAFTAKRRRALDALVANHVARKQARGHARAALGDGAGARGELDALARESRADDRTQRERRRTLAQEDARLRAELAAIVSERRSLEAERRARCNEALHAVQDTYMLQNALGVRKRLRELFSSRELAGGAGDCAGPKLLLFAYEQGLTPLAMAEFWWGPSPRSGDRHHGHYYPACHTKCATVLPFMLEGLDLQPAWAHDPCSTRPGALHEREP